MNVIRISFPIRGKEPHLPALLLDCAQMGLLIEKWNCADPGEGSQNNLFLGRGGSRTALTKSPMLLALLLLDLRNG